jgi:hypothetical protein
MLFPVAGPDRSDHGEQGGGAAAASVSMRELLASCAAARAVSVPPAPERAVSGERPAREAA